MFLTQLELTDDPQPRRWIVLSPLIWLDPVYGLITVPVGFRTDLASVPPVIRDIPGLDPIGISRRPAAMHDWLYASRGFDRDRADQFLRDSLLTLGASAQVANIFYRGVHDFGQRFWDADADRLETQDFDTKEHYWQWLASLQPNFTTQLPGVLSP